MVLATVAGMGGALIRDGIFIQNGPPAPMRHEGYLIVCVGAALFTPLLSRLSGVAAGSPCSGRTRSRSDFTA